MTQRDRQTRNAYKRDWYAANRAAERTRKQRAYFADPELYRAKGRTKWRKFKYGISQEQFDAQLILQQGRCAICKSDSTGHDKDWHVDHDHTTGKNRGLLCQHCNLTLGLVKDDTEILRKAIEYLQAGGAQWSQ